MNRQYVSSGQQGTTLIVTLIMLMMMMSTAIVSFRMSQTSLEVIGNMQVSNEADMFANDLIQEAISSPTVINSPNNVLANPCAGVANTRCHDVNSDGDVDVIVRLNPVPQCRKVQIVTNAQLDLSRPQDRGCIQGEAQDFGIAGAASGDSLCTDTVFEVTAEAEDLAFGFTSTVVAGIAMRVSADAGPLLCPP